MKIDPRKWIALLGVILFVPALSAGQTNMVAPDYVGSATHQLFENYLSGKTAVLKEESEIPREYWTEPIKALNPASIYQQHGNVVIVLRIQDGAEQGWYVPTSPSFCEPYLGIRMEDGFTFTDHDRGHGCEFSRTRSQEKKKQPAIADSFSHDHINAAIQAYWNYSLALRKGDERLQEGSPPCLRSHPSTGLMQSRLCSPSRFMNTT